MLKHYHVSKVYDRIFQNKINRSSLLHGIGVGEVSIGEVAVDIRGVDRHVTRSCPKG